MSKFFTTLTAVDNYGGKSFFSGEGKTEQESIDKALLNKQIGIGNDDEILAIRTYDNLSHVKMKHAQMQHTGGPPISDLDPYGQILYSILLRRLGQCLRADFQNTYTDANLVWHRYLEELVQVFCKTAPYIRGLY